MVAPEDQWEWGTLEMKMAGRAGSEQQKYLLRDTCIATPQHPSFITPVIKSHRIHIYGIFTYIYHIEITQNVGTIYQSHGSYGNVRG